MSISGVEGICTGAEVGKKSAPRAFRIGKYKSIKLRIPIFATGTGSHEIKLEVDSTLGPYTVAKQLYIEVSSRLPKSLRTGKKSGMTGAPTSLTGLLELPTGRTRRDQILHCLIGSDQPPGPERVVVRLRTQVHR